ncbi:SGT1-domain-containing protein [Pholiota conissans]|uniref:SGT1-domain-containing protein n=1 Tax=Pholiota conissans TaxID=109636 RepID=A0A9P6CPS9_9AGAR|nr:SGT1-domain-containing protein [Pholiota conissans]
MDIFNRPHSIAEDTLHYTLYPPSDLSDRTSATSFAACIADFVASKLQNFIWHRDAFELKVALNPDNGKVWILEGRMRVGDCIDDEWLAVWILKEISSRWDVVISVYDSDGEFLLIEAAEVLPSWVKPTNSENRVWIYNSHLHLIPLSHVSPSHRKRYPRKIPGAADSDEEDNIVAEDESFIAAEDAVYLVRDTSTDTLAPPSIEKIVWNRISGYPNATMSHVHNTKAYIPVDIAKALAINPSLVQRAVETFYTRDAIQLRAAHRMNRFPPNTSLLTSVRMTRIAYAQLLGQKFFPPKIFGNWKESEGSREWKQRTLGMKIAVGFEMLYQENKGRGNAQNISLEDTNASTEANKDALRRTPDYRKYIENLCSANYFQGQTKGSELWNTLENKAATAYVAIRQTDNALRQSFTSQVDEAIAQYRDNLNFVDIPEDSDDWLNIDAQEFEQMLEASYAKPKDDEAKDSSYRMEVDASPEHRLASEQAKRLKDLASKVETFIEGEGGIEGALFEDEEFSEEEFSDEGDEESESENETEVNPHPTEEDKQVAMDKLVPALEPADYGKMPASYHINSQRVASSATSGGVDTTVEVEEKPSSPMAEKDTKTKQTIRPPIIPRDEYDGVVDSDDETDEENEDDDGSEEDRPQVVGDIEIDMDEEEEEFLEFSRQALGISDQQWSGIIKDRQERGAFLPVSATKPSPFPKPSPIAKENTARRTHTPRVPEPGPRPNVNPDLDSFEAVMRALDEALTRKSSNKARAQKSAPQKATIAPPLTRIGKGKETTKATIEDEVEDGDFDIEAAMAAELKGALEDDWEGDEPLDYNMIKNFLESYKSQQGLSGPVSNLAGRLQPEFKLPRDDF